MNLASTIAHTTASQSLRKKLLLWLSVPMLMLIVIDSTLLYNIARHFQREAFDHELGSTAYDISQLISQAKANDGRFYLSPQVRAILLSSRTDQMYYSIVDTRGKVIGGDPVLQWAAPSRPTKQPLYFVHSRIGMEMTRVAVLRTQIETERGPQTVYVQVAETLRKRQHLAGEIFMGIVVPQLLLLLITVGLLWLGIDRGLAPLRELNNAILQRSPRDLSPVQLAKTPDEVHVLVNSINSLMGQLEGALELQNRFTADAAHQLRTPLAGMQAQLDLAQDETDPVALQDSLARISIGMRRLIHMVNQLLRLAYSQPEAIHRMDFHEVDLNWLAQQAAMHMVPAAYQKEIDLGFEGVEGELNIQGDTQRLTELINNLLDNALRYTQAGGKVTMSLRREDDHALLCVEDNGPGIPVPERGKVFDRFHRILGTEQEGSGLGLAIVKEIAQIHHAAVSIETPDTGSGTRVCVRFGLRANAALKQ